MAIVLSGIDSRAPAEIMFNLGIGDIFDARVAGTFANTGIIGSMYDIETGEVDVYIGQPND